MIFEPGIRVRHYDNPGRTVTTKLRVIPVILEENSGDNRASLPRERGRPRLQKAANIKNASFFGNVVQ